MVVVRHAWESNGVGKLLKVSKVPMITPLTQHDSMRLSPSKINQPKTRSVHNNKNSRLCSPQLVISYHQHYTVPPSGQRVNTCQLPSVPPAQNDDNEQCQHWDDGQRTASGKKGPQVSFFTCQYIFYLLTLL